MILTRKSSRILLHRTIHHCHKTFHGIPILSSHIPFAAKQCQYCSTASVSTDGLPPSLMEHLKQRIKATGPITVASYMKEALTNPVFGYYMKKDVFGSKGDFTTSPEISQMFGELVAVWFVMQWSQMGKPPSVKLVELGPGRGTLMKDILRVIEQFVPAHEFFSIHFVEVSEEMRRLQKETLRVNDCCTEKQVQVHWYDRVQDVPSGVSFYIAHEFFDALPVHLFKKVDGDWREILVNLSDQNAEKLVFVTAPGPSPIARSFLDPMSNVSECEVCPDAAVIMSCITENLGENGGCGLIVDYGEHISDRHSIRAFKDHELYENILDQPGHMDLTANVDFGFLKKYATQTAKCHGPVPQQTFLFKMGIRERLQALKQRATDEQKQNLISSFEYLTSSKKMGEKFKVMAVTTADQSIPPGFE